MEIINPDFAVVNTCDGQWRVPLLYRRVMCFIQIASILPKSDATVICGYRGLIQVSIPAI